MLDPRRGADGGLGRSPATLAARRGRAGRSTRGWPDASAPATGRTVTLAADDATEPGAGAAADLAALGDRPRPDRRCRRVGRGRTGRARRGRSPTGAPTSPAARVGSTAAPRPARARPLAGRLLVAGARPLDGSTLQPPHADPEPGVDIAELDAERGGRARRARAGGDRRARCRAGRHRRRSRPQPLVASWGFGLGEAAVPATPDEASVRAAAGRTRDRPPDPPSRRAAASHDRRRPRRHPAALAGAARARLRGAARGSSPPTPPTSSPRATTRRSSATIRSRRDLADPHGAGPRAAGRLGHRTAGGGGARRAPICASGVGAGAALARAPPGTVAPADQLCRRRGRRWRWSAADLVGARPHARRSARRRVDRGRAVRTETAGRRVPLRPARRDGAAGACCSRCRPYPARPWTVGSPQPGAARDARPRAPPGRRTRGARRRRPLPAGHDAGVQRRRRRRVHRPQRPDRHRAERGASMPSITSLSRLEPSRGRRDVTAGAAAPVADPLWLLARQWQVGEFQAEDGGTPIVARWRGTSPRPDPLRRSGRSRRTPRPRRRASTPRPPAARGVRRAAAVPLPAAADIRRRRPPPRGRRRPALPRGCSRRRRRRSDYRPAFIATFAVAVPERRAARRASTPRPRLPRAARRPQPRRPPAAGRATRPGPCRGSVRQIAAGDGAEVRAAVRRRGSRGSTTLFSQPTPASRRGSATASSTRSRWPAARAPTRSTSGRSPRSRYGGGALDWYSFDGNGEVNVGTDAGRGRRGSRARRRCRRR